MAAGGLRPSTHLGGGGHCSLLVQYAHNLSQHDPFAACKLPLQHASIAEDGMCTCCECAGVVCVWGGGDVRSYGHVQLVVDAQMHPACGCCQTTTN